MNEITVTLCNSISLFFAAPHLSAVPHHMNELMLLIHCVLTVVQQSEARSPTSRESTVQACMYICAPICIHTKKQ